MRKFRVLTLSLLMVGALATPGRAAGTTFTVNTTADGADLTPGDGICATGSATCSLRAALQEANAFAGSDTVQLPNGNFGLSLGGLSITTTIDLRGEGPTRTIITQGSADTAILSIQIGASGSRVEGLTLQGVHGNVCGAMVINDDSTLEGVRFSGNSTTCSSFNSAVLVADAVDIYDSQFTGNNGWNNGVIQEANPTPLLIKNTTISGNAGVFGGAVYNPSGPVTIESSTISGNTGTDAANITFYPNSGSTMTIRNSIISAPTTGPNCTSGGSIVSAGGNIEDANSCGFTQPSDQTSTDPQLLGLVDNGGGTETMALSATSPALDTAVAGCFAYDQRGAYRSDTCDSGAYERVTCFGQPVEIVGTLGSDTLVGKSSADVILAQGGADLVRGGGGNDRLCGGDQSDVLKGGAGNDRHSGGAGADTCAGGSGSDIGVSCETSRSIP